MGEENVFPRPHIKRKKRSGHAKLPDHIDYIYTIVRWPVPGFSRAFLSYFSVTSQLFCRNFSHISHFSVISQLFLVYFAVISHFSIISHLFLKHFAVISHFSVRLPTISHFSVTLPNYFPVTSRFSVRLPNLFSVTSRIFPESCSCS